MKTLEEILTQTGCWSDKIAQAKADILGLMMSKKELKRCIAVNLPLSTQTVPENRIEALASALHKAQEKKLKGD